MSLPVTVPFTFGNATTAQSLSSLDTNFTTITNSINGLTNGASKINVASITATGTANATTYLRGDGAWATISGGGSGTVTSINANSSIGFTFTGGPVTSSGTLTLSGPTPGTSGNVLTSNGTAWVSQAAGGGSGGQVYSQLFTTSGTWTAPTGVTRVRVWCIGGGGGGAFNNSCSGNGAYGGGGGTAVGVYTVVPGTGYTVTIGAGGAGATAATNVIGSAGGTTSFGGVISATGGVGGDTRYSANANTGTGSSGTVINSSAVAAPFPFMAPVGTVTSSGGSYYNTTTGAAQAASGQYAAGLGGQFSAVGRGGVGGIVYLEWVQ